MVASQERHNVSNSNILHKVASAAFAAGLVVAGSAGTIALAPAAQAAASFCCAAQMTPSSTDPSAVTASLDNYASAQMNLNIAIKDANGKVIRLIPVSIPPALAPSSWDDQNNYIPATPYHYVYPSIITVLPGQTVQAVSLSGSSSIPDLYFGNAYTNTSTPALPSYQALKPGQVGNVITVPAAQSGVIYVVVGGAGKALAPGQQITLTAGQTLTIAAVPTTPPLVTLTGTVSWSYTGVQEGPAQLTPAGLTHVSANLYTVPAVTGYHYEVGGKTPPAGDFYVPAGGVTVVAVSNNPAQLQLVGQTSWQLPYVTPPKPDEGTKKVMVCHATGSDKNPYVSITVSVASLRDGHGHAGHDGDIYPEFTYKGGDDYIVTVPGKNWTPENKAIYEANCEVPAPPSGDTGDHGGDTGHDHGGDTGGNTGGTTGGDTGGKTGGDTSTSSSTTNTTSSSTVNVTVQQPQTPVANQAPVTSPSESSNGEVVMRAATAADPTDPSNLGVAGGIALVMGGAAAAAVMLLRRSKVQA